MALSTVTLKWNLADLIEAGLDATLTITPSAVLQDPVDHITVGQVQRNVIFSGGTGQLAGIIANDSANLTPAGTGYTISVTAEDGQVIIEPFTTQILIAGGATQWLDGLEPVEDVTTMAAYMPLPTGTPSAGQAPLATGAGQASAWGTISGRLLCPPSVYAPATDTVLTVSTQTMAAFDSTHLSTGNFTAPPSGEVLVTANFVMQQSASGGGAFGLAAHGTVSPIVAPEWLYRDSAGSAVPRASFITFPVTGLTPGQTYNFDLVGCIASGITMSILAVGTTSASPTLNLAASGGPVVMTVQAV